MLVFETDVLVRFRHCDPARIVFYPRYFEILNDVIEDWYAAMGTPFSAMMDDDGVVVPMVTVAADFVAPSRLGEMLHAAVEVTALGRTSCTLGVTLCGPDGTERVRFRPTMVCVRRATFRPEPWPESLRAAMGQTAFGSARE